MLVTDSQTAHENRSTENTFAERSPFVENADYAAQPQVTPALELILDLPERFDALEMARHASTARHRFNHALRGYVVSDAVAMIMGFVLASGMAAALNSLFMSREGLTAFSADPMRMVQFLVIGASALLWFQHTDHYRLRMPFWAEVKKVMGTMGFAMMADGFLQFAAKQDASRFWLIAAWLLAGVGILALRQGLRGLLRRRGSFEVSTLLVGSGATARNARAALDSEKGLGYNITAQVENLPRAFRKAGQSWRSLCAQYHVDYVIIALDGHELAEAELPIAQLMREPVAFSVAPPVRHLPVQGMVPQYFFNSDTMLLTRSSDLEHPLPQFLKRAVDICASGFALLLLSPIMLVVAAMVKRDGGSALYGHMRLGRNGTSFPCYKFRSMVVNGDEVLKRHLSESAEASAEWQVNRKLVHDPRVTRIGDFLRRSSLDELPQLINVLKGHMSLVGPRPIVTAEIEKYDHDIAHYYRVRPGITGLWQVSGRSDVSYPQRVQMDSWYVRNWSLWHDIAILCKTLPALMKRSGAY